MQRREAGRGARMLALVLASGLRVAAWGDWPMLHANARHDGFVSTSVSPPFRLAWVRDFSGERLGTAMEPIVAEGKVFVATHRGHLYALDADTGEARWRFQASGPFLHSPAYASGLVVGASEDGNLYAVAARTGQRRWQVAGEPGGFAAAPVSEGGVVFLGTRRGRFIAVDLSTGQVRWETRLGAPVRQTAAVSDGQVFVTAEDLRVYCFDARTGMALWTAGPVAGQTARDYYPVVVRAGGRRLVVVRTNPVLNMSQRNAQDRAVLARNAGIDDGDWRKVEAWTKSEAAAGGPDLWEKEQQAVLEHLREHREARTCAVFNAENGAELTPPPVLWVGGCQGVGTPPAQTADGSLLVLYRSAYGNWNLGVAPLVALGLLDLGRNRITPLAHANGRQPPWNTFWGTADESQNLVVASNTVLIAHQGTLSGFDLPSRRLYPIHGERDTYGGRRSPPWARNEWHGPARGGVAVSGPRLFWLTGSRVFCLAAGESGTPAAPVTIQPESVPAQRTPAPPGPDLVQARRWLGEAVQEVLARAWAPLFVEPGLGGREFFFGQSADVFTALAWAYPWLTSELQGQVKTRLAETWREHPPFAAAAQFDLAQGDRRERFWVPESVLSRRGDDGRPQPFAGCHAAWWYGERCGARAEVDAAWPQLKSSFAEFVRTGWRLHPAQGDLQANRYLAALLAVEQLAQRNGDVATAAQARTKAAETADALVAWWRRAAEGGTLDRFDGSTELDRFIGNGDAFSLRLAPHRHKMALFEGLTPEVAAQIAPRAPGAVETVWRTFDRLYATWWLAGEERQVHYGENFVDPPDLAFGGFAALAWLKQAPASALIRCVDLPWSRADLYYVMKLALTLEAAAGEERAAAR